MPSYAVIILDRKAIVLNSSKHTATGLMSFGPLLSVRCHTCITILRNLSYLPASFFHTTDSAVQRGTYPAKTLICQHRNQNLSPIVFFSLNGCQKLNELPQAIIIIAELSNRNILTSRNIYLNLSSLQLLLV